MDFNEKNSFKINRKKQEENNILRENIIGLNEAEEKEQHTYHFLTNMDVMEGRKWDYGSLSNEFYSNMHVEEKLEWNDAKAEELAKKSNKYSAKDRKNYMAKCKKIRKEKLDKMFLPYNIKKHSDKTKLKYAYDFINYQFEAREQYIRATMKNENEMRVDLAMNKMRKYYQRTRLYVAYLYDAKIDKEKRTYSAEIDKAKEKLAAVLKEAEKLPLYEQRFSWSKVVGGSEKTLSDEEQAKKKIQEQRKREEDKKERERQEKEAQRAKTRERILVMLETGKWTKTTIIKPKKQRGRRQKADEVNKKPEVITTELEIDSNWMLKDYIDVIAKQVLDNPKDAILNFPEDLIASRLKEYNTNVKENFAYLKQNAAKGLADALATADDPQQREAAEYVGSGFSWINQLCYEKYEKKYAKAFIYKDVAKTAIAREHPAITVNEFKEIRKQAKRWDKIKDIDFKGMGIDVYSSDIIKTLLTDKNVKMEDLTRLKKQLEGVDKLLHRIVTDKYGYLNHDRIYAGLRRFIGNKALFAGNNKIKDLSERYLLGLSYTDKETAMVQKDFEDAYEEQITVTFGEQFKFGIEKFLTSTRYGWDEVGTRKTELNKRLKFVNAYLKKIEKHSQNITMSGQCWDEMFKLFRNYVANSMATAWYISERDKEVGKKLDADIRDTILSIKEKDKGEKLISFGQYIGELKEKKEAEKKELITDYSYSQMLDEIIEGEEFKKAIPDDATRVFLRENKNVFLFRNKKLAEQFPYMKGLKDVDELEELSYEQFENVSRFIVESLTEEGVLEAVTKLLKDETKETESKRRILLRIMSDRTDAKGVEQYIKDETDKEERKKKLRRQKLLISVGTNKELRDGKIRYRYEDLRDRDKGILQTYFGKNSGWLKDRIKKFDKANSVWKRIEKMGPDAVKVTRYLFEVCYESEKPEESLELLAKCFSGKNVLDELTKNFDIRSVKLDGENDLKEIVSDLTAAFRQKDDSAEQDLLDLANKSKIEKTKKTKTEKPMEIKDFILEMSLCGTQDILLGHEGKFQKVLFMYEDKDDYPEELRKVAKFAIGRMKQIDNAVAGYPPAVQAELGRKLMRTCMNIETEKYEEYTKFEAEKEATLKAIEANKTTQSGALKELAEAMENLGKAREEKQEAESRKEGYQSKLSVATKEKDLAKVELDTLKSKKTELVKGFKSIDDNYKSEQKTYDKVMNAYFAQVDEYDKAKKAGKITKKLETKLSKTEKEYSEAARKFNELSSKYNEAVKKRDDAINAVEKKEKEFAEIKGRVSELKNNIAEAENEIKKLEARYDVCFTDYENRKKLTVKAENSKGSLLHDLEKVNEEEITQDYYAEVKQNIKEYGLSNMEELKGILNECIDKNGVMSGELQQTIELYNARKKILEEYEGGELAVISGKLLENSEVLMDLLDPAESVAMARISTLYEFFAPFAAAVMRQSSAFLGDYYLEDNLEKLLSGKGVLYNGIYHTLKEQNDFDGKVDVWREQLQEFGANYVTQQKKGSKSINENLQSAGSGLQKKIAKYYYGSGQTKDEKKLQKAQFTKYWFINSKNYGVELAAEKGGQNHYQIAMHKAQGMLMQINAYVTSNADCIQQACIQGTLENLYKELGNNYIANDASIENYIVQYVLATKYKDTRIQTGMFSGDYNTDDETLLKIVESLPPEQLKEIKTYVLDFKNFVRDPSFRENPEEFSKNLNKYAKLYFDKLQIAIEEESALLKENADAMRLRKQKEEAAEKDVVNTKYEGRKLYNEKFFDNRLDALKSFGEQKQTLIYLTDNKKKNKSIRSVGAEEDAKIIKAAKEYFTPSKEEKEKNIKYPDILAECLAEYMRQNYIMAEKLDRFADWMAGIESRFSEEAKRLKNIYNIRKEMMKGEPDEGEDAFIVYAARFTMNSTEPEKDIKALSTKFNSLFKKIRELEAFEMKNPALRMAHKDACEKMRALIFMHKDITPLELNKLITAQAKYFLYADQAYQVIEDYAAKDSYLGKIDLVYRNRYLNGAREYFTARIIEDSLSGKVFDSKKFESEVRKVLGDEYRRNALVNANAAVSNLDLEHENIYPGAMSRKDFEHILSATRNKDLVKQYNELTNTQRRLFAMALYCMRMEEHGSQKVLYGQSDAGMKEARGQILSYMKGNDVDFNVDYTRSIRAVSVKRNKFKISADKELFKEAFEFVKKVEQRKEELRPKEFERMGDAVTIIRQANKYRGAAQSAATNVADQLKELDNRTVGSKNKLLKTISDISIVDVKRQQSQGFIARNKDKADRFVEGYKVDDVMERVSKLSEAQKSLLVYVLQDRTVLDFSTAGKNEKTGIVPHANQEKRFKLFEKLLDEKGRFEAITEAGKAETVKKAYATLLSFQLKDNKELSEKELSKDDFAEKALDRVTAIDWKLLSYAIDFLEEVESERRKIYVVRQSKQFLRASKDKKKHSVVFYNSHKAQMTKEGVDSIPTFESIILMAYKEDIINNDTSSSFRKEADDMMSGYNKLTEKQKLLFIRALEHRDILDVSQKNLYKNVFGLADRDFVNEKGRDELADEFLEKEGEVELKEDSCLQAFESLLSDQINDDTDFSKVKGVNWANKNLAVNNQIFVTERSTVIDWKLFKRALQFVTRTVNEKKQNSGNEAIYNALGDKDKNGELKIDTNYLRMNLHNTGSRFMRFLAKEGYSEIEDNLGIFEKMGDYAGYILSTKTNNFIQGELNTYITKRQEEAEEAEAKKDGEEKEEKKKEDEGKLSFVATLKKIADDYSEQKKTLEEMFKQASEEIDYVKGLMSEEEKLIVNTDELKEELKDVKLPPEEKKGLTGYKYVDLAISGGTAIMGIKGVIDEYAQNTEMLENIDKYIDNYLGGFMSAKGIGEWYQKKVGLLNENGEKPKVEDGFIDKRVPDVVKQKLDTFLLAAEKSGQLIKTVKEAFFDPSIEVLGDFKSIYESYKNISELNEAKEKSGKKHESDNEKIEKAKLSKEEKEAVEQARQNNIDLLNGGNDMTKNIESRKILLTTGELAQKILKYAGQDQFNKFIDKAFKFAGFIWHCISDEKAIKNYYGSSGNEEVKELFRGKEILMDQFKYDNDIKFDSTRYETENGKVIVGKQELRMLKNGLGFESEEELVKFLRLNIVNSLLFSSSKFNPLEETRLLAECTLTVLGLESSIGKTDNDTARKVFDKLSA